MSALDGMGGVKQIVERAVRLGWGAAAITEHGHMMSAASFYQACRAKGIKPILGNEMYIVPDAILGDNVKENAKSSRHLTVLALSKEGYQNLVAWTSFSMQRVNFYGKPRISLEAMAEIAPWPLHHNVILSGCLGSDLCQALLHANGDAVSLGARYVESMKTLFPNFYVEVQDHWQERFAGHESYEEMVLAEARVRLLLVQVARKTDTPIVLTNDSHYQDESQRKAHMAMLASKGWKQSKGEAGKATEGGTSKTFQYNYWSSYLQSMEELADRSKLTSEVTENVLDIVRETNIKLDYLDTFSYSIPDSGYKKPVEELRQRGQERLKAMVEKHGEEAQERFDSELEQMSDFAHYLCLMADFIRKCNEQGILTDLRGSAAGSLVAYCVGIHDVDPIHFKLTFARFYNPVRKKLPDIDIDVESDRIPDVIRLIHEHMDELEGKGQVLPICTYGTLANRSAFRVAANALGMSKEQQDEIAKLLPQMIDSGFVSDENDVYGALKEEYPELYETAQGVFDNMASLGQHPCGLVFGTRERPLSQWVPTALIPSSNATVTQYNMKAIESLGLCKMDWLKQDTLSIIRHVLEMIGKDLTWYREIPLDDAETFQLLREGKTLGIHSFQGKTQRKGCIEARVETIQDLIAVQALYRPSGTRTGFVKHFIQRRRGKEEWEIDDPVCAPILNETYGLPIYQEQTLEMCIQLGMDAEEQQQVLDAIKMAKGTGRGAKEAFEAITPTFHRHAAKSLSRVQAEQRWELVEASQGYQFNRAHATAYALRGYRMAYLKAHYPEAFAAALLDKYPRVPTYIADARAQGLALLPPDVNKSAMGFSRSGTRGKIRVGLLNVRSVGEGAASELVRGQPYRSLDDLKERTSSQRVKSTTIENLAAVGALRNLGVRASADDLTELQILGFCLDKPEKLRNVKPKVAARTGGSWTFQGLYDGVDVTEGKVFVAKLFWIPPLEDSLELVASAWANVNSYLLRAVDVNGIPFDLIASEQKEEESRIIRTLAKFGRDSVVCVEGRVNLPFLEDRPTGFQLWGISGADNGKPQMWGVEEKGVELILSLAKSKKMRRAPSREWKEKVTEDDAYGKVITSVR